MGRKASELHDRASEDDELYDRFASHLEKDNKGKYVVISRSGELLISENDTEILQRALQRFGRGKFVFRKIGSKVLGKWR